jgi:hypothetical protein
MLNAFDMLGILCFIIGFALTIYYFNQKEKDSLILVFSIIFIISSLFILVQKLNGNRIKLSA